jgi:P4 family phage/plasmid primase-like protien
MSRTKTNDTLQSVLQELDNVQQTSPGEWKARCPAHDDTNPSLSVSEGDSRPVVLHCHAGCDFGEVADELDSLSTSWKPWEGTEADRYTYEAAYGEPLFDVVRYEMRDEEHPACGEKTFVQQAYLPEHEDAGDKGCPEGYVWGRKKHDIDPVLYRLPEVMKASSDDRFVFVVEGEKDVHTLEEWGFTATTNPQGAGKWQPQHTEALEGAHVVILPDNDPQGREHGRMVAQEVLPVAESVRLVELPGLPKKGDVTDWAQENGSPEKLKKLLDEATPLSLDENGHENDLDSWEEIRATFDSNKGEGRVEAAEQLIEELNVATHRRSGHLYVWDDTEKVYADDGEASIRERLVDVLRSRFSQREVNEILGMVKAKTYREEFGADGFVPVANGDLKVSDDTVELAEATPEHGFRNRSPAEWDPDADAPIFQTYLKQVVKTEEERKTLQEYAGYSLMYWGLPLHKALFLVGPQASGKSTFLNALQQMLGKTTHLSPQQLVDDEYGAIELEDSWANIASDIPSALLSNVGRFKEITAGDRIRARRIYEQGYTIRPTAKHFYSANQLPEIKIDDNAFFRRVIIVAFPETVDREDRDPKLGQNLKLEIDGILRWAVEGLQRLLKNEDFTRDLTPQETRRLWDEHASSIGQFKIRCLNVTGDNEHAVPKDEVYDAYGQFCMDKGLPTESQQKLTRVLKRDPRIGQAKRTPPGFENQVRCYTGVELKAGGEDLPF